MFQDPAEAFRAWKEGSREGFESLYASASPRLLAFCRLLTREEGAAQDLFQDAWKQAVQKKGSFRFECPPDAWLAAIARNLWRMDRRRAAVGRGVLEARRREAPPEEVQDPQAAEARELLGLLPEEEREVAILYHYRGLTLREAGAALGVSHVTARARLVSAHERMRGAVQGKKSGNPLTTRAPGASGG